MHDDTIRPARFVKVEPDATDLFRAQVCKRLLRLEVPHASTPVWVPTNSNERLPRVDGPLAPSIRGTIIHAMFEQLGQLSDCEIHELTSTVDWYGKPTQVWLNFDGCPPDTELYIPQGIRWDVPVHYEVDDVTVVGSADGVAGDELIEIKTSSYDFKSEDYWHSLRWQLYAKSLGLPFCRYIGVKLMSHRQSDAPGYFRVSDIVELELSTTSYGLKRVDHTIVVAAEWLDDKLPEYWHLSEHRYRTHQQHPSTCDWCDRTVAPASNHAQSYIRCKACLIPLSAVRPTQRCEPCDRIVEQAIDRVGL